MYIQLLTKYKYSNVVSSIIYIEFLFYANNFIVLKC